MGGGARGRGAESGGGAPGLSRAEYQNQVSEPVCQRGGVGRREPRIFESGSWLSERKGRRAGFHGAGVNRSRSVTVLECAAALCQQLPSPAQLPLARESRLAFFFGGGGAFLSAPSGSPRS